MSQYDYAVFRDHNRHTCIRVSVDGHQVKFIPMEAKEVKVVRMADKHFISVYTPYTEYPVKRAAEIYLFAPSKEVSPQAREHLERIIADPAFEYDRSQFNNPPPQAARKEDDMAAAKKTPAAKTPAEKPAKKSAKAAAEAAEAPKKRGGRPRADDNATYTVGDDSSVKRGFIADYVAAAKKLGNFTRDKLNAKMAGGEADDAKLLRYFYYCTGHGIFKQAA